MSRTNTELGFQIGDYAVVYSYNPFIAQNTVFKIHSISCGVNHVVNLWFYYKNQLKFIPYYDCRRMTPYHVIKWKLQIILDNMNDNESNDLISEILYLLSKFRDELS